jgi:hypothetical protein
MNYAQVNYLRAGRQRHADPPAITGRPRRSWEGLNFRCPTCKQPRGSKIHRRHMRAANKPLAS